MCVCVRACVCVCVCVLHASQSLAMSFWEVRSISPAFQVAAFHWLLESGERAAGAPLIAASKWLAVTMLKAFVADASDTVRRGGSHGAL